MFSGSAVVTYHRLDLIACHLADVFLRNKTFRLSNCLHSTLTEEEVRPFKVCGLCSALSLFSLSVFSQRKQTAKPLPPQVLKDRMNY